MRELEKQFIAKLIELRGIEEPGVIKRELAPFLKKLYEEPLGQATLEFISNKELVNLNFFTIPDDSDEIFNKVKLKLLLETYLLNPHKKDFREKLLKSIEDEVMKIKGNIFDSVGQGLFSSKIISKPLIRDVYLSGNKDLIAIFSKHLPVPNVDFFSGHFIPQFIQERSEAITQSVLKFLKMRSLKGIDQIAAESEIIGVQRKFRAKRRQKEERQRIAKVQHIAKLVARDGREAKEGKERKEIGEQDLRKAGIALADANTPYVPKIPEGGPPRLAERIIDAANKVKLFSSIHHLTSAQSLESIFNDSLYGQKSLLQKYLPFKPAALDEIDLLYGGDANVICFGPQQIDPRAIQQDGIDIVLDLNRLPSNPCIFYKQLDLGFNLDKLRELRIGDQEIFFCHTSEFYHDKTPGKRKEIELADKEGFGRSSTSNFMMLDKNHEFIGYAFLPKYNLIAYDVPKMRQILTLNFFRFLDNLKKPNGEPNEELIQEIYSNISKLNDVELIEFLEDLGQKMTDTAEFNFYGAYKIDFSAIESISIVSKTKDKPTRLMQSPLHRPIPTYTIEFKKFIEQLNAGDEDQLKDAIEKIPTMFRSYRFLDYLISQVHHKEIQQKLLELKQASPAPLWMKEMEKTRNRSKTSPLEKELLSKIALLQSGKLEAESKEKAQKVMQDVESLQKKIGLGLKDKLSNGKTLEEELKTYNIIPLLKDKVFAMFGSSKPDPLSSRSYTTRH